MAEPAQEDPTLSPHERWLDDHRLKIALGIGAVEGVAAVAGAIPWWLVLALAVGGLSLYVWVGRQHRSSEVRTITWIAAVSQVLVLLVPVAAAIVAALAVVVVVLLGVAVLVALLRDRGKGADS